MDVLAVRARVVQGFRKVSPDRWEFAHAEFLAGQRPLLVNIQRRRGGGAAGSTASTPSSAGAGGGGDRDNSELKRLRRDREALARELTRLRREQEEARAQLLDMERRVRGTERRQEQCTASLARAVRSPAFLDGLLARRGQGGRGGAHVEAAGRKRRLLDAAAAATAPDAADVLAFEELALAAGAEVEAAAQISDAGNATDMMWYELLGEEQVEIDAEVDELVAAAAATEAAAEPWAEMDEKEVEELVAAAATAATEAEPWAEMDDEEVEELVQQIDCIGSTGP